MEEGRVRSGKQHSWGLGVQAALVEDKNMTFYRYQRGTIWGNVSLCRCAVWRFLLVNLFLELPHSQCSWVFILPLWFVLHFVLWFVPWQEVMSVILSPWAALEVTHVGEKEEVVLLKCVIMARPRGNVSPVIRMGNVQKAWSQGYVVFSPSALRKCSEAVLCAFHKCKSLFTAVLG